MLRQSGIANRERRVTRAEPARRQRTPLWAIGCYSYSADGKHPYPTGVASYPTRRGRWNRGGLYAAACFAARRRRYWAAIFRLQPRFSMTSAIASGVMAMGATFTDSGLTSAGCAAATFLLCSNSALALTFAAFGFTGVAVWESL